MVTEQALLCGFLQELLVTGVDLISRIIIKGGLFGNLLVKGQQCLDVNLGFNTSRIRLARLVDIRFVLGISLGGQLC